MKIKSVLIVMALILSVYICNNVFSAEKSLAYPIKITNLKGHQILIYDGQLTVFLKKTGINNIVGILPVKEYKQVQVYICKGSNWDVIYVDICFEAQSDGIVEIQIKENYIRNSNTGKVKALSEKENNSFSNPPVFTANGRLYFGGDQSTQGLIMKLNGNVFEVEGM